MSGCPILREYILIPLSLACTAYGTSFRIGDAGMRSARCDNFGIVVFKVYSFFRCLPAAGTGYAPVVKPTKIAIFTNYPNMTAPYPPKKRPFHSTNTESGSKGSPMAACSESDSARRLRGTPCSARTAR